MSVLAKIANSVKERLELRKQACSFEKLEVLAFQSRKPLSLIASLTRSPVEVIAEVKFKSPALGVLKTEDENSAVEIATQYFKNGAAAISVLTEEDHFKGNLAYLRAIRNSLPEARLLMKDFVLEEYQLLEARVNGADAALLIVSLLGAERTAELMRFAERMGLETLVEVHDEAEFMMALEMKAPLIGVNNRNLKTLEVNLETSFELAKKMKSGAVFISESGIDQSAQMKRLAGVGYQGFLMGTAFMKKGEPGAELSRVLSEARS